VQGFTFEYELVPGVPSQQADNLFRYLVQIDYDADVELPWEPIDGGALRHSGAGPLPMAAAETGHCQSVLVS
jgi:hypothetical protein